MLDAIIIGGGHNGLVCANYLAKAGKKVKFNILNLAKTDSLYNYGMKINTFSTKS